MASRRECAIISLLDAHVMYTRRIISARRANLREKRLFDEEISKPNRPPSN
jgi:uncharacterized DUF497 family protein